MSDDARTPASQPERERLDELLVDRALVGLTPAEERELAQLLAAHGERDPQGLELSAAALDLALSPPSTPLPAALRARLVDTARAFVLPAAQEESVSPASPAARAQRRTAVAPAPRGSLLAFSGWLVAAAALVVALFAWWSHGTPATLDAAAARAALLARSETIRREWSAPGAPGASGDVAWSQELQQGYLKIEHLAANDPTREQYQLWIFDDTQEHPIDGGVFDVTGPAVLVPIDAKLHVQHAQLFAVTREKPGGVVVSDQQRIVLVAKL